MSANPENNTTYDLTSVKLPVLSGIGLRLLTWLMESPFRALVQNSLLEKAGIIQFRKLVLSDLPTFIPLHEPDRNEPDERPDREPESPVSDATEGFCFNTIADYARCYREGILDPVTVAERLLTAIEDSENRDKPLRAFVSIDRDDILRQAEAAAARIKQGKPLGLLDGVPVPIKDQFSVRGYPTTTGTGFLGKVPVREDAASVARLREAGAIIAGKVNMHELGLGATGINPHHGVTRNPYNPGHFTGGSSSGSATAVAAGLAPVSLGADGGGSIRIPSSFCGLTGLKPTFGRVSMHGDSQFCWSVEHVGPIAASAADAATLYQAIAGPDLQDSFTLRQPPVTSGWAAGSDLSDLTIGVYPEYFRHAEPETVAICESMVKKFESMGARVREISIPELEAGRVAQIVTIAAEISQSLERYYRNHHTEYGLDVRINLAMARSFTSHDYLNAQRVRTRMMAAFRQVLENVDVIITPTTGTPAPLIPEKYLPQGESNLSVLFEIMRFATPANMTGLPAISFPAGYTKSGLPVGLHVTAKAWQEATLLRLASLAETIIVKQRPQVYFDLLNDS